MVGKSVVDVEVKDGMGGTSITFEDGSVFHSIYSRFTP
jgi:hypothetical protein